MKTKEIDGIEYILKTDVDELIRSRITKVSERARIAEDKVKELEPLVESAKESSEKMKILSDEKAKLEEKITVLSSKYERHSLLSENGFVDPNIRDCVEWNFERAKAQDPDLELGKWLEGIKKDPSTAPSSLKILLSPNNPAPKEEPTRLEAPSSQTVDPVVKNAKPDSVRGVIPGHDLNGRDLIESALNDPAIWRSKNEDIKAAWYKSNPYSRPIK